MGEWLGEWFVEKVNGCMKPFTLLNNKVYR